jgi:hypothetical protein
VLCAMQQLKAAPLALSGVQCLGDDENDGAGRGRPFCKSRVENRKAHIMRKIVLLGATAIALALGAVSANAFPNISPEASPYAVLVPESAPPSATTEGRAALVGGDAGLWSVLGAQPNNGATTPEDRNSYSRGR